MRRSGPLRRSWLIVIVLGMLAGCPRTTQVHEDLTVTHEVKPGIRADFLVALLPVVTSAPFRLVSRINDWLAPRPRWEFSFDNVFMKVDASRLHRVEIVKVLRDWNSLLDSESSPDERQAMLDREARALVADFDHVPVMRLRPSQLELASEIVREVLGPLTPPPA
ncbi:hypothetical protein [Aquisphaera insulae]|uniref:hypothetical protein n=1 Tax=Aquisphaera insulae TaxID=2712864 RepID=UPI0013EB4D2D|nr:hypothetical protein [Aquisphaera insulae]